MRNIIMKPTNFVLLKPFYLLPDKHLRSAAALADGADERLASATPVGKIISVRCVGTSRDEIGVPSHAEVVKIGQRTAKDFQSVRQIARALWRGAKLGIEIVLRNPATDELCAKTLHAKLPDGLVSFTVIKICAKKMHNYFFRSIDLFVHYDKNQLRSPPWYENHIGLDYLSLPTMATIIHMETMGMSAAGLRMIPGMEIVQVDNYTAYDFRTAAQIKRYLKRHSLQGVKAVLRNPHTEELDVKVMHGSLQYGPSPYSAVKILPRKPDLGVNRQQKGLYIHHNKKQIRWTAAGRQCAQAKFGQLRTIAVIASSECVAKVGKKNPFKKGTQIVQIGERTAANFRSKGHVARFLSRAANRGVKVILRNPATGALDVKMIHAGKLDGPAPYTLIQLGIKEVIKSDTMEICLFAQYNQRQLYKTPDRYDAANRMWRDAMRPIGKIASILRVGFAPKTKLRMAPGGDILQIGNFTAQNFLSTPHIMQTLLKRAKQGIDVVVRDPITGMLDKKIFHTHLTGGPCPYTLVKMNIKMPVSSKPGECYVSFARAERLIRNPLKTGCLKQHK